MGVPRFDGDDKAQLSGGGDELREPYSEACSPRVRQLCPRIVSFGTPGEGGQAGAEEQEEPRRREGRAVGRKRRVRHGGGDDWSHRGFGTTEVR